MKIGTILDAFFFVEKTLRKSHFRLIMPIGCDSSPLGSKILFSFRSHSHALSLPHILSSIALRFRSSTFSLSRMHSHAISRFSALDFSPLKTL